jgi:hypothetical protein
MANPILLPCDGCEQLAAPEHFSRRLQRLEWATRFRPIHIQTLLLGAIAPEDDQDFLYAPEGSPEGEARILLEAVQIAGEGKSREAMLTEFQKRGLMLTHILECPLEVSATAGDARALIEKHLSAAAARIRRSLKAKRVFLLSAELRDLADTLRAANLGCPVLPASTGTFLPSPSPAEPEFQLFRAALAGAQP